MSFIDKAKDVAGDITDKAGELVDKAVEAVPDSVKETAHDLKEKAGELVDKAKEKFHLGSQDAEPATGSAPAEALEPSVVGDALPEEPIG